MESLLNSTMYSTMFCLKYFRTWNILHHLNNLNGAQIITPTYDVCFFFFSQQSQSDRSMSVISLNQQLGIVGKGSPYKRVDSMKSERSSISADDESRRVSFDVEEPGRYLKLLLAIVIFCRSAFPRKLWY